MPPIPISVSNKGKPEQTGQADDYKTDADCKFNHLFHGVFPKAVQPV